jgi:hypothetical protein
MIITTCGNAQNRVIASDHPAMFEPEQALLQRAVRDGRVFYPRVDRRARICVRTNRYSVPVHLIGRKVRVLLHSSELVVFADRTEVARQVHPGP